MDHALGNGSVNNTHGHSHVAQAWLVLLLAVCFGAALATVQIALSDNIAENKRRETFSKIPALVPGDDGAAALEIERDDIEIIPGTVSVDRTGSAVSYPIYRVNRGGRLSGWVVKAAGHGYSGKIELLLGLDPDVETITGLLILEQKETPGLGNKIIDPAWRSQFTGKKTVQPLSLRKTGASGAGPGDQGVDAISGATISSRAVTGIVNVIVGHVKGNLTPQHIRTVERKM